MSSAQSRRSKRKAGRAPVPFDVVPPVSSTPAPPCARLDVDPSEAVDDEAACSSTALPASTLSVPLEAFPSCLPLPTPVPCAPWKALRPPTAPAPVSSNIYALLGDASRRAVKPLNWTCVDWSAWDRRYAAVFGYEHGATPAELLALFAYDAASSSKVGVELQMLLHRLSQMALRDGHGSPEGKFRREVREVFDEAERLLRQRFGGGGARIARERWWRIVVDATVAKNWPFFVSDSSGVSTPYFCRSSFVQDALAHFGAWPEYRPSAGQVK